MVHASRRRPVRPAGPSGRAAPVCRQSETSVHRAGRTWQPGGVRTSQPRVRRKFLHGRPRRDYEPRDPGPGGTAHQTLPKEPVHHARRRRAGQMCAKVRRGVVHVVLRGNVGPLLVFRPL